MIIRREGDGLDSKLRSAALTARLARAAELLAAGRARRGAGFAEEVYAVVAEEERDEGGRAVSFFLRTSWRRKRQDEQPTICRFRIRNARLCEPIPGPGRWLHYICGPLWGGWRLGLPGGRGWCRPAVAPYQPNHQRHDQDQRQQRNKEYSQQNECARLHADIALHHRVGVPR